MRKRLAAAVAFALVIAGCNDNYLPQTSSDVSSPASSGISSGVYSGAINAETLAGFITQASLDNHVPAALVYAVLRIESGGNPNAVSKHGAVGLMQLMPATVAGCGLSDAFDPRGNIECGASYLSRMLARFSGNVTLAIAAYNAGPGAVTRYGGVPPQSKSYVERVLTIYRGGSTGW